MGATFSASAIFRAVDMISAPARRMESSMQRFSSGIKNVEKSIIGLGGAFALGALVKQSGEAIVEFDSSIASLKAITGLTGEQFKPFKKEIFSIGDATKKSYVDVAKAMELIGSAQPELLKNSAAMGQMTKASILLSKASGMDLTDATGSLSKALNQFGVGADQALKYVDILSTSEQKGTATTNQIVESLLKAGPVAKTLGISFDHTNAIIQGFAKAGIVGSEAGTQMASAMSRLTQSSNRNFNPAVVGATKAIDNLSKAHLTYPQLVKMYGMEAARFIATLINQNDVVQGLAGNLYIEGNAMAQAEERSKAFSLRITELKNRFSNLMITGNETSGALNSFGFVIKLITDHLGLLMAVVGGVITYYVAYRAITMALTAATFIKNVALGISIALHNGNVFALRKSLVAMNAYKVMMGIATAAQWAWNVALSIGMLPLTLIIAGIGALVGIIAGLAKRWDGIKQAFQDGGFLEGIKAIGNALLSVILKPIEWILKAIGKMTGAKWATNMASSIGDFRGGLDKGLLKQDNTSPVNKDASVLTQKKILENNTMQNVQINIDDSTGRARVGGQLQPVPIVVRNTKGF